MRQLVAAQEDASVHLRAQLRRVEEADLREGGWPHFCSLPSAVALSLRWLAGCLGGFLVCWLVGWQMFPWRIGRGSVKKLRKLEASKKVL